ncbi:hypothetical protein PGB90_004902 [Kerria lacca]
MSAIERIEITKPKSGTNTGTVIFLHGSGGTGQSVKEWIDMLRENETFSHLKILYPTASMRPYTPLKGEEQLNKMKEECDQIQRSMKEKMKRHNSI